MDTQLRAAIRDNQLARVRQLVEHEDVSPNVGEPDDNFGEDFRWRPLYLAVRYGHTAIVRYLLTRVHRRRRQGKTALCVALRFGRSEVAELLAPYAATGSFEFDEPPLVVAVRRGTDLVTFRAIVELDAGLEERGGFLDTTPLGHAAYLGRWAHVRVLLEAGVNPNVRVWTGDPASRDTAYDVIMGTGPQPPIPGRNLASQELREFATEMRRAYRGRPQPTRRRPSLRQ